MGHAYHAFPRADFLRLISDERFWESDASGVEGIIDAELNSNEVESCDTGSGEVHFQEIVLHGGFHESNSENSSLDSDEGADRCKVLSPKKIPWAEYFGISSSRPIIGKSDSSISFQSKSKFAEGASNGVNFVSKLVSVWLIEVSTPAERDSSIHV